MKIKLVLLLLVVSLNTFASGDVSLSVPFAPIPVVASNDKTILVYELDVKNLTQDQNVYFNYLNVCAGESVCTNANKIISYEGKTLLKNTALADDVNQPFNYLKPNTTATIFIWIAIPKGEKIPIRLTHTLAYHDNNYRYASIQGADISVHIQKPIILNRIVKDNGIWAAMEGPNNENISHRRGLITILGVNTIASRFAIDWLKLVNGQAYKGNGDQLNDWYGFGVPVVAATNGTVTALQNGIANNAIGTNDHMPAVMNGRMGNYVIIQSNNTDSYLVYCHLQSNLTVKLGEKVTVGQVIGYLGNSGDAKIPHLHFQVITPGFHPMLAHGLPYEFNNFYVTGFFDANENYHPLPNGPQGHQNEIPLGKTSKGTTVIQW